MVICDIRINRTGEVIRGVRQVGADGGAMTYVAGGTSYKDSDVVVLKCEDAVE